jgi:hypothetical protein
MSSTRVFEQLINHLETYKTLQFHNDSIVNLAKALNIRLANEIEESVVYVKPIEFSKVCTQLQRILNDTLSK